MTTELFAWAPPDGTEVLITWLSELGETRDERPSGGDLPFRMVNRIIGTDDRLTDMGHYSIHTFAETKPDAQYEAGETHKRLLALAGQFTGQQKVTISDGQEVYVDDVKVIESPHFVQWDDENSLYRFVGTYRVDLRYVAT
jgi:hypothetical protein